MTRPSTFTDATRVLVSLMSLVVMVQSLTPDGGSWIHPGRPFVATHTTPTRHVGKERTRLQTDPYGMPSYGKLEDDAFVPVQDDPSRAVADFGKPGKSLFQEFDERKRAAVAAEAEVRANHPNSRRRPSRAHFEYTTSAAQASFQNRRHRNPTPSSSSPSSKTTEIPRPDNTIHFHRYTAEARFRQPKKASTSFDDERRRTAEASFGRGQGPNNNSAFHQQQRGGFTPPGGRRQQQQPPRGQGPPPPPPDNVREFERFQYTRTREDWKGPVNRRTQGPNSPGPTIKTRMMRSPQEEEFYFAVQPTIGGMNFGVDILPEFYQHHPFEFFSGRSTTSFRNRPLTPDFAPGGQNRWN